jgi:hypothetical protein
VFPKGFRRFTKSSIYSEKVIKFVKNPELVYNIDGLKPNLSPVQEIMMGKQV